MAPTLLPTFTTTPTTNDRGREGAKEGKTAGHKAPQGLQYVVPAVSIRQSINPSINQRIGVKKQFRPLLSPIPSHPIQNHSLYSTPCMDFYRKLLCHTHTHTHLTLFPLLHNNRSHRRPHRRCDNAPIGDQKPVCETCK